MASDIEDKILKTGHLFKQGGSYRNWNRRYFVLRHSTLSYYVSEGDKTPKGVINLAKGRGVRFRQQCQLEEGEWPRAAANDLAFGLAVNNRTYYMYGYDKAAVDDWKSILDERIHEVGNPDSNYKEDISMKPERMSSRLFRGGGKMFSRASKHFNKSESPENKEPEEDLERNKLSSEVPSTSAQSPTTVTAN